MKREVEVMGEANSERSLVDFEVLKDVIAGGSPATSGKRFQLTAS